MFKILTDPTQTPVREIDLSNAGAQINFIPSATWSNTDIVSQRPDGGYVTFSRKPRSQIQLQITKGISNADWQTLMKIWNRGDLVEVGPNWDTSTRFYAPLSNSITALRKDPDQAKFYYQDGTWIGGEVERANYIAEEKRYELVAASTPRYRQSALGKGIYFTGGEENILPNKGHSTSGTPIWFGVSGSPSVTWTETEVSPATFYNGCTKVVIPRSTTTAYDVVECESNAVASTNASDVYVGTIWIKGRGKISQIYLGASSSGYWSAVAEGIQLTGQWQQIKIKSEATGVTGWTNARFTIIMERQYYESVLFIGPASIIKQNQGPYLTEQMPDWDNTSGSYSQEYVRWQGQQTSTPDNEMTLTVLGVWPEANGSARLFDNAAPSINNLFGIYRAEYITIYFNSGSVSTNISLVIPVADRASVYGRAFWACARIRAIGTSQETKIDLKVGDKEYTTTNTSQRLWLNTVPSQFLVGGWKPSAQKSVESCPQQIRLDERYWSDEEVELHKKMFTQDSWKNLLYQTLGKQYRIADINMNALPGSWDTQVGTITLEEVNNLSDMEVQL